MSVDQSSLEIERIDNLLVNFAWKVIKQEITDNDIILTIQKKRIPLVDEVEPVFS